MCLAVPGRVVAGPEGDGCFREAWIDFAGMQRRVNLACTPDAKVGDYVLVHAGIAITVLRSDEAAQALAEFHALQAWEPDREHEEAE